MPVKSKSNNKAIEAEIDRLIRKKVEEAGDEVVRLVQEQYRKPKAGRVYRVGKTPTKADRRAGRRFRGHQASAPGQAPAIDTGALSKATTRSAAQKVAALRWSVSLGVTAQSGRAEIARWLEVGTRRIAARPGWRIALAIFRARMKR